ncbi:MAG: ABC transporter transmembrane domain-containing protein [Myxococcales bacterium]
MAIAVLATFVFAGATSLYAFLLGPLLKVLLTGQSAEAALPVLGRVPPEQLLAWLPIALVLASVVRASAQALQAYLMQTAGQRVVASLRRALYARYLELHQGLLNRHHSADLLARFGADVQGVEFALTSAFASYVKDGVQVLTLLGVCAVLDWRLLLVALLAVPVAAFPIARFARSLKGVADESQQTLGALATRVGEAVANVRIVQGFRQEEAELARLDAAQQRYLGIMNRSFLLRAAFTPVLEMLGVVGLALALYFAGSAIATGALSGEALLSFLASLMLMYQPLKSLSSTSQHVIQGMANAMIDPFLLSPAQTCAADVNQDNAINTLDIPAMVTKLLNP